MQSNWYYDESYEGFDLSNPKVVKCRPYLQLFIDLDRNGFDQIPCGTNWVGSVRKGLGVGADDVIGKLIAFARKNISSERLKGFMMAPWEALDGEAGLGKNLDGIRLFAEAMQNKPF